MAALVCGGGGGGGVGMCGRSSVDINFYIVLSVHIFFL